MNLNTSYSQIKAVANGKPIIISETGWPTAGNTIGNAVASLDNAARYFCEFTTWAHENQVDYWYFEAFDEPWKADSNSPQEVHWGIWDKFGNIKVSLRCLSKASYPKFETVLDVIPCTPYAGGDKINL